METISSHTVSTPNALMRMLSQRSKFLHGHPKACWANTKTISSLAEHTWNRFNRLLSISRIYWWANGEIFLKKERWTAWWSRLWRWRLIYGGRDSSTEEETHLRRRRLVYGREYFSMEGETLLRRGRLISFDGGKNRWKLLIYCISSVPLKVFCSCDILV